MNYLFLTKTAFFNGLSENEIKTILNCLGAYQKSFKKSEFIYRTCDNGKTSVINVNTVKV